MIISVLLHCFPPAEPITPGRLSGIQGPSRKDSLDFWINTELGSTCTNAVREELIIIGGLDQLEVEKEIQFVFDISEKYALTFMQIWNMELNITNYRLWVYVSFIIVITINAMISNLRGHCVCLIYFLGKLSISFPSEDLFVGLLVTCPHWHRLGPASLGISELLAGSLSNHNQAWFSLHPLVNYRSHFHQEVIQCRGFNGDSRWCESRMLRIDSTMESLCHRGLKCVWMLTFCECP